MVRSRPDVAPEILRKLYWDSNLNLTQIGLKLGVSGYVVREMMVNAGIPRRNPWEAAKKFPKSPFSGDSTEAAYLSGLRTGDLYCQRYGNQIRVATSTTHPAMWRLITECFGKYGRVNKTPARNKQDFEWLVYAYLDNTFSFMLPKAYSLPSPYTQNEELFLSFLSGYVDAEGSFRLYQDHPGVSVSLRLRTEDEELLRNLKKVLQRLGYHPYFALDLKKGHYHGKNYNRNVWMLGLFRKTEIAHLAKKLSLRHEEKRKWSQLVLKSMNAKWDTLEVEVRELRSKIDIEVREFTRHARSEYNMRRHQARAIELERPKAP